MLSFIKEFRWQRKYYCNGTLRYLLHKFDIAKSPTLTFQGIKPFKSFLKKG